MAESSKERWTDLPNALVPSRFSFVPHTERNTFDYSWRELHGADEEQLTRIVSQSPLDFDVGDITRFTSFTGWTARGAFRNKRSMIAVALSAHVLLPDAPGNEPYNDVKFFWVYPDYYETNVPLRLLALARLELPELPTRVVVEASADKLLQSLRDAGWNDVTDESAESNPQRRDLRIRSLAGREYREALAQGSRARYAPPLSHGGRRRGGRSGGAA